MFYTLPFIAGLHITWAVFLGVPDIDLDFPRDIREELILRVYAKYGYEHTGLVCTFPTYRLKSAVREIGKTLDLPMGELEKLSKPKLLPLS